MRVVMVRFTVTVSPLVMATVAVMVLFVVMTRVLLGLGL